MKNEVNPIVVGAVLLVIVVVLGYFGWKAIQPAQPPAGSYTPGVPPWMDPKNANSKPGGGNSGAPMAPQGAPAGTPGK